MKKPASEGEADIDYLFKLVLIGDSGVGKTSLLWSCTCDRFECRPPTIGVDWKSKYVTLGGKKLKIDIWDTAGQERYQTFTNQYYRGAQGFIMVYDVTRRETFTNLAEFWNKEIDQYKTNKDCVKMVTRLTSERAVTKKEGIDFARKHGCRLYLECSTKTRVNVENYIEELVLKIMETPSLLSEGLVPTKESSIKLDQARRKAANSSKGGCC